MSTRKQPKNIKGLGKRASMGRVKFEVYGNGIIEKKVGSSGTAGKVYLPPEWVGHQVRVVRLN